MNWKFLLILIIAISFVPAGGFLLYENIFQTNRNPVEIIEPKVNLSDDELKNEIGQMLMIGFRGIDATEDSDISKIIKDVKIGGVALFDYDVPSNSYPRNIINPEQTKKLIFDIQKQSSVPMFVAADAEGGNVNRLKEKYGFLPILSAEKMGEDKTLKTTEEQSAELSNELKNLGFNMNFAPVVDLNINPKNPIIGALGRSFSPDPEEVVKQAEVFIKNHSSNNIIAVAKHFVGQGGAKGDTHLGAVDTTNTFSEKELLPFKELNNDGLLSAVMVGHIINKKIDENYPATLSPAFLQGILRNQIGFKGVIISDDMQMGAITKNYNFDDAIIRAVNAGCDVISVLNNSPEDYDNNLAYKVRDIIFDAVKQNKIGEEKIAESYNRIIDLKKKFKIILSQDEKSNKISEIRNQNFELLNAGQITFGQALDMAQNVEKITGVRPAFLLGVLQEELSLEKTDLCYLTNLKTGEGVRELDGQARLKTMKPDRDIADFIEITKELGKDPLKTLITCPMSFGWGGAMGPADFIPSTWIKYKDKIEKITGKPADPYNTQDAFLAAGLYLSDSGAKSQTRDGEWDAAMIYFSDSINSPYTFYANDVIDIANQIQLNIDIINRLSI